MAYEVTELNRYPIKSMGQVVLSEAIIDRFGIQMDRRWMVVDEKNRFLTQRKVAKMTAMSVVEKTCIAGQWELEISAGGSAQTVSLSTHFSGETISVSVWKDQCEALVASNDINQWLSEKIGINCRLVFMADDYHREVDPDYAMAGETVSFADGFPLLLTTQASLESFNTHLQRPIKMVRFRPNIVLSGSSPYEEDKWKRIRVGNMEFSVVKPCSRCVMPTINPQTSAREPEVFKALKAHRAVGRDVFFGQNIMPLSEGVVRIGDKVEVLE